MFFLLDRLSSLTVSYQSKKLQICCFALDFILEPRYMANIMQRIRNHPQSSTTHLTDVHSFTSELVHNHPQRTSLVSIRSQQKLCTFRLRVVHMFRHSLPATISSCNPRVVRVSAHTVGRTWCPYTVHRIHSRRIERCFVVSTQSESCLPLASSSKREGGNTRINKKHRALFREHSAFICACDLSAFRATIPVAVRRVRYFPKCVSNSKRRTE